MYIIYILCIYISYNIYIIIYLFIYIYIICYLLFIIYHVVYIVYWILYSLYHISYIIYHVLCVYIYYISMNHWIGGSRQIYRSWFVPPNTRLSWVFCKVSLNQFPAIKFFFPGLPWICSKSRSHLATSLWWLEPVQTGRFLSNFLV